MKLQISDSKAIRYMVILISVISLSFLISQADHAYAKSAIRASASYKLAKKSASITVKWKPSKKVGSFRLQLFRNNGYGSYSDPVKSVMLSKKRRSYTFKKLEKNEFYSIRIDGYSGKKAIQSKRKGRTYCYVTTGVSRVAEDWLGNESWNNYLAEGVKTEWYSRDTKYGIKASGIQIYRREDSGSWKKIATVKRKSKKSGSFRYTDKSIVFNKTYQYRARAYAKVKKGKKTKTKFGRFTTPETVRTYRETPRLDVSLADSTPASEKMTFVEVDIKSDGMNNDLTFHFGEGNKAAYVNTDEDGFTLTENTPVFLVTEYKEAGGSWKEAEGDVTLKRNSSLSLRLNARGASDYINLKKYAVFIIENCTYRNKNNCRVTLWPDPASVDYGCPDGGYED